MKPEFEISQKTSEALDTALIPIFEDYNASHDVEAYKKVTFNITIKMDGKIIGGLTASSVWNWFYIENIGIDKNYRGLGYAKKMVLMAEKEAQKRNCYGIWLHTMSFQAPDFYKKLGYVSFGEMENCAGNHQRIFMKKALA